MSMLLASETILSFKEDLKVTMISYRSFKEYLNCRGQLQIPSKSTKILPENWSLETTLDEEIGSRFKVGVKIKYQVIAKEIGRRRRSDQTKRSLMKKKENVRDKMEH